MLDSRSGARAALLALVVCLAFAACKEAAAPAPTVEETQPVRLAAAQTALTALRDAGRLSRNTADILERTLAG